MTKFTLRRHGQTGITTRITKKMAQNRVKIFYKHNYTGVYVDWETDCQQYIHRYTIEYVLGYCTSVIY